MTDILQTRRGALAATLAAAGGLSLAAAARAAPLAKDGIMNGDRDPNPHAHDWDWLVGSWKVRHHRLKGRLVGSTEWEDFDGTSTLYLTLGGLGTIDDNLLELPVGTYRAVTVRAFNPKDGLWSIWWLDARNPGQVDPPVRGSFKDGVGTFTGPDVNNGKPVICRYEWSRITPVSAHWEQALSPDDGRTWEVNWRMDFTRA